MAISTIYTNLKVKDRKVLDRLLEERRLSYRKLAEWAKRNGHDITEAAIERYARATGKRRYRPARYLLIDKLLTPEHRLEYEALLANPRTSLRQAHAWLSERGYPAGRDSVILHRRRFNDLMDSMRESARVAREIANVTRVAGASQMSEGVVGKLEQVILEQLVRLREHNRIDPKELGELTRSVSGAVNTRETLESIRREFDDEKRKAAKAAEDAAKTGASGKDVVVRMREILGV